jgi:hypothetical protein
MGWSKEWWPRILRQVKGGGGEIKILDGMDRVGLQPKEFSARWQSLPSGARFRLRRGVGRSNLHNLGPRVTSSSGRTLFTLAIRIVKPSFNMFAKQIKMMMNDYAGMHAAMLPLRLLQR